MYPTRITISARTHEQFFPLALARLRGLDLPLRLLLGVLEVFGGETSSDVGLGVIAGDEAALMVLGVVARGHGPFLRVTAVVDHFFDLMFDLLLADGAVGVGRVL